MIDLLSMLSREKPTVTEANQRETGKQGELIHLGIFIMRDNGG